MLFKTQFFDGIREGTIDLTFRSWKVSKVIPGRRYRISGDIQIEVDDVRMVTTSSISDAEACRAGFQSRAALIRMLRPTARATEKGDVYRISFHRVEGWQDPLLLLREDVSQDSLQDAADELNRIDRRSRRGPWAWDLLALIRDNPKVSSARLAPTRGRERRALKSDVRRLKGLGLTISCKPGYELSPRGEAVLEQRNKEGCQKP